MANILIVDDSKFMRAIIRDALTEGGHHIIGEAENGFDALDRYRELKPDLVTMDVTMWGKDGLSAVDEIMNINPDARIVMISALNERTMKTVKMEIKAKAFITKPFNKDELIKVVNSIL
jgi:two-component system, chemotaxis family, chemotaxis protein CheY